MYNYSVYHDVIQFGTKYRSVHGYIAFPLCIFGFISNVLNVTVLSRKELRSATNYVLLGIAICHLILNAFYSVNVAYQFLLFPETCDHHREYPGWIVFTLISIHTVYFAYSVATWFTVDLALIRCIQLKSRAQLNVDRCPLAVKLMSLTVLMVLLCGTPNYLTFNIRITTEHSDPDCDMNDNSTEHWSVGSSEFNEIHEDLPYQLAFWINGLLFFLIPSGLLSVFVTYLVATLADFAQRRRRLKHKKSVARWHVNQQTLLLLIILAITLTTQLPQGILNLLCSILSLDYRMNVYQNLGELMELLSLINGSVGFILYCTMSSQFRDTFNRVFRPSYRRKKSSDKVVVIGRRAVMAQDCRSKVTDKLCVELNPLLSPHTSDSHNLSLDGYRVAKNDSPVQNPI